MSNNQQFTFSIQNKTKSIFVFTDNNATIDCYTIHNQIYQSIKNNTNNTINDESNNITNITKEDLQNYNIYVFLDSILLTGGSESTMPYNECFFGSLTSNENPNFNVSNANRNASDSNALDSNLSANDSNLANTDSTNDLDESKPVYYLECDESDLDSRGSNKSLDSSESYKSNVVSNHSNNSTNTNDSTQTNNKTKIYPTNQTLQIFLNNHRLTILNYSILDSSLNIKLECVSKESNKIKENEINQRNKAQQQSNTPPISTAFLCPILECDELKCIHGGQVKLTSNVGKTIKAMTKDKTHKDSPIMLESDLLYSPILNCPNNIAGIPNPCTQIALILPNARGLKKYNDDYPIMQDLCVSGVFSDKGFPIICTKKENTLKIQSPKPSNNILDSKEVLESNVDFSIPTLSIITAYDGLDEFYFTPSVYENRQSNESIISTQSNFYNTNKSLDFSFDSISNDDFPNDLANNNTLESILESLTKIYDKKHFSYRIFSVRVA